MSAGYCYIAERCNGFNLADLADSLSRFGIQLANPTTGLVTKLSESGEQIQTDVVQIARFLEKSRAATFQFWFVDDVDLSCSFRRLPGGVCVHAYSLDGKNREQRRLLKDWASEYFRAQAINGTAVLVVFDPYEIAGDFDWDSFITRGGPLPHVWPELLGSSQSRINELPSSPSMWRSESIGDYRLFSAE